MLMMLSDSRRVTSGVCAQREAELSKFDKVVQSSWARPSMVNTSAQSSSTVDTAAQCDGGIGLPCVAAGSHTTTRFNKVKAIRRIHSHVLECRSKCACVRAPTASRRCSAACARWPHAQSTRRWQYARRA